MPIKPITEKILDDACSLFYRTEQNFTCERCGRYVRPPTNQIQCSHFYSRAIRSTRFEADNLDILCYSCHKFFETRKNKEYMDWKKNKLGTKRFEALTRLAYRTNELKRGGLKKSEKLELLKKFLVD